MSEVNVKVTATLAHRRASSDCCGAGLAIAPGDGWSCLSCGQVCGRTLSDPETIEATNG